MTTEDTLKSALNEYAKAICKLLSTNISSIKDQKEIMTTWYDELLSPAIYNLPEYESCRHEIRHHPVVGKQIDTVVGIRRTGLRVTIRSVILEFMTSLFNKQGGITFSKRAFNSVYREMMNFFESETIRIQDIVPLENFASTVDSLDLGDSWRLAKIPEDLKAEWWKKEVKMRSQPLLFGTRSHLLAEYALIKEHEVPRVIGGSSEEGPEVLDKLIEEIWQIATALRLLKEGRVIPRVRTCRAIGWSVGARSGSLAWNPNIPETPGPDYTLETSDISELKSLVNSLRSLKHNKAFEIALRRLNYSIERSDIRIEDKVLDSMIGLESLYIGGEKGELRYRLSLRASFYLAESSEKRIQIRDDLKYIYDLRSYLVHGYIEDKIQKHLQKRDLNLAQAARLTEGYLRRTVKKVLKEISSGKSVKDVISRIDDDIMNG